MAPGPFPTENAWDKLNPLAETGVGATQADEVPLRRFGKMDELRNLMIFLMSDGCSYITGDTISIDGGHHLAAPSTFAGLSKLSPDEWQRAREAIQASTRKEKEGRSAWAFPNRTEQPGRSAMGLAIATTSFECAIDGGLAHIVLNQPQRGNLIDGEFCREFSLCMAELSERDDVRSVLISARGRLFSVGGDLSALASRGAGLPATIKSWTADLHAGIVRMVRMRAPVVVAVQGSVAGGSVSLMAAADLVVIGKSARISSAFAKIGFTPDSGSTTTLTRRIGPARAKRFFLMGETIDADTALSTGLVDYVVDDDASAARDLDETSKPRKPAVRTLVYDEALR